MIGGILYVLVGIVVAVGLMVLMENRTRTSPDPFEQFLLAVIAVMACGFFWPLVVAALVVMLSAEYLSDSERKAY